MSDLIEKNYYQRLNISRSASKDEIRRAYRELATVFHPDAGMYKDDGLGSEHLEIFKLLTEAYNVLMNESSRLEYDKSLPKEFISEEWVSVYTGRADKSSPDDKLRKKFQEREPVFGVQGEVRGGVDLGKFGGQESVMRSAVFHEPKADEGEDIEEMDRVDSPFYRTLRANEHQGFSAAKVLIDLWDTPSGKGVVAGCVVALVLVIVLLTQ